MNFREFEYILSEAKKRRVAPIKPEGMDDIAWEKLKNFKYR